MLLLEKTIDLKINIGRKEGGGIIKVFNSITNTSCKESVRLVLLVQPKIDCYFGVIYLLT